MPSHDRVPPSGGAQYAPASGGGDGASYVSSYDKSYGAGGGGGPDEATLQLHTLQLYTLAGADAEAVCNDGSPGAYYFAPGDGNSNDWIIYLEGGMWCWNKASCQSRFTETGFEMSSSKWAQTQDVGGIFSTEPSNPWSGAQKVYIGYCSSDAWVGDAPASPETYNFAFRGQRIISATLADLAARHGLDGSASVLFGGCSAGARGAMFTLDYVQAMLPPGARLRGLLDSSLWLDLPPPDAAEVSLQAQTQMVYDMVNPSARIPPACAAAFPGEEWMCLYGQYRLPYVQTPYIINAAQFDSFQLLYDLGGDAPQTATQVAFADEFQRKTLEALAAAHAAGNAVFSTSCLVHCLTADTQLYTSFTADGKTIAESLTNWYFGGATPDDVSSCTGYPCVASCPNADTITGLGRAEQAQRVLDGDGSDAAQAPIGSEINGVWVYRQQGMGFGGGATASGGGQGYVQHPTANQDDAVSWMSQGRRLLRDSA